MNGDMDYPGEPVGPAGPFEPVPEEPDRRLWWIIGISSAVLLIALIVLVATRGNGDDAGVTAGSAALTTTPPEGSATGITLASTTTTTVATTTSAEETTTTEVPTTDATTSSSTTSTTAVPTESRYSILVASPSGIQRITDSGTNRITDQAASIAVERDGVVYYQTATGRWDDNGLADPSRTSIKQIDATGVRTIISSTGQQWLKLHDVGVNRAGAVVVLYSVDTGEGPPVEDNTGDPQHEDLYLFDVASTTSTKIAEIGAWESGTGRLTWGTDVIVGTWSAEASHGLLVLGPDGTFYDESAKYGLADSYEDCSDCPDGFSVNQAGQQLAWIDQGTLNLASRVDGTITKQVKIVIDVFTSTDVSGDFAVLNRFDLPPLLIDAARNNITQLPAGTATIS